MRYEATEAFLPVILETAAEEMINLGLPGEVTEKMRLVLEEAFVNIIRYAYKDEKERPLEWQMTLEKNTLKVVIKDWGIAFNPCSVQVKVAEETPLQERAVGGLGIFFIKKIVDDMSYRRMDNSNELTLIKKL